MKTVDFASAILWNRSALNGAAWMSCILILEDAVLELRGDSGTVFRSRVSAVTARITPMGDLEIRTAGDPARYRLTVYANMTTPLLTPQQVRVLRDAQLRTGTSQRARPVIPEWRRLLAESGAHVTGRRGHGPFYLVAACVAVPAVALMLLILAALTAP